MTKLKVKLFLVALLLTSLALFPAYRASQLNFGWTWFHSHIICSGVYLGAI